MASNDQQNEQINIFDNSDKEGEKPDAANPSIDSTSPLAYSCRPSSLEDFHGQQHIFEKCRFLQERVSSLILWGPPGTGKTTLAHILADRFDKELYSFNAVLGGVNELRKLIDRALEVKKIFAGKDPIIFIDEIHRFNRAQQDALLPYVESGEFILFGATTENPRSSVNRALISRVQVIELKKLSENAICKIINNVKNQKNIMISQENIEFLAERANGDARRAINTLESLWQKSEEEISSKNIKELILENCRDYDKKQDRHYDVISAFIKSMRGSDPDAALLWLAVMIDGGEDAVFIARRLVIFASEDIGNADPWALDIATNVLFAVKNIGMPEARINLSQAVTYLASTVKSNACYQGINAALDFVKEAATIEVPEHLRNFPDKEHPIKYKYPHDYQDAYIKQSYSNKNTPSFYQPSDQGRERILKERLQGLR